MIPGVDKNVRVVRLQIATGKLIRPVQRIFPLEACFIDKNSILTHDVDSSESNKIIHETFTKKASKAIGRQSDIKVTKSGRVSKPPEKLNYI